MKFGKFLAEKENKEEQHGNIVIIVHRIFGAIDHTHINYENNMAEFNVGQAIKDKNFKSLNVAVKKGSRISAKFAVKKNADEYYIVVTSPKFKTDLSREELTSILEDKGLSVGLHDAVKHYIRYCHDEFKDSHTPSGHEIKTDANTNVEANYNKLIQAFKESVQHFNDSVTDIDRQSKQTANNFKASSYKMAKDRLKEETFGKDFKGFLSLLNKLPEGEFIKHLESDSKKKIISRLQDYYEHYSSK